MRQKEIMDIRKFIKKARRVSFRDFMEHALYCPEDGYYGAGKVKIGGPNMDFVTHPVLTSPFFGRGIARQINQMWLDLERPAKLDLVEVGGGDGVLARDILSESKKIYPDLFRSINYLMIEISPALIKKQKRMLGHFKDKVTFSQGSVLDFSRSIEGVIISNEVLDSMPVHRLVFKGGKLNEIYVKYDGKGFSEEIDQLSNLDLREYFIALGLRLFADQHLCVNLEALRFLEKAAQNLKRGYIMTIDYGDLAEILFGDDLSHIRVNKERQVGVYPYRDVPEADITSDVDFTSLRKQGARSGLKELLYLPEDEYFKYWLGDDLDKSQGVERFFEQIIGSNHKVLIQAKNMPSLDLKKILMEE
jgi:SAM-dependent MidA family methyltransferase